VTPALQLVDPVGAAALRDLLRYDIEVLEPARQSFGAYWKLTKPDMAWNWFNDVIAAELQQFYEDVYAGKQPRLMLFAPPRHGKSEGTSRRFPSWVFGQRPNAHIMACSYAASLAQRMNRDVQRIMDTPLYTQLFPNTRLNVQNVATLAGQPLRNSDIFEIVDHLGSYRSAGVGGGITGQGFEIGIIDDPVANAQDANSDAVMTGLWEWYQQVFYNRQAPMAGIVVIMTRWVTDDLAGRLLEEMKTGGEQWKVVRFPAVAEEDEKYRKAGDALCPARYPIERLKTMERASGSYTWAALYQQRPGPKGGIIFNRKHWKYWKVLPEFEEVILSVDCTFKDLQSNDYVAIGVWGRTGANKYLCKRLRERMGFAATVLAIRSVHALFPACSAILIEDKANGSAVIETLKEQLSGVLAVEPLGGKVARAYAMQPEQEAGNLYLPDPEVDNDIETFLSEASAFPGGHHDDEVDEMTQAVNWFRTRSSTLGMLQYLQQQAAEARAKQEKEAA
jgi:predicted phage terminase large subunit-like protein